MGDWFRALAFFAAATLVFLWRGVGFGAQDSGVFEDVRPPDAAPSTPVETSPMPGIGATPLEDEAFVDGLIAAYMSEHGAAGYVVSMVRDGRLVFSKGYGLANAETGALATGDATRFWIGSISKTFVWTAVMMAVERGEIDLDTDVNQYLKRYQAPAGEPALTMNDLMAHRVGFEDVYKIFLPVVGELPLDEALAASEPKGVFARSGPTAYSNWATTLAALILEDVTERTYEDILFNDLLLPLGMTSTTLTQESPAAAEVSVARSYKATAKGLVDAGQLGIGSFSPIGGMTSTATDMSKWMLMHLGEGRLGETTILSPETYALMRARAFNDRLSGADMAHGMMEQMHRATTIYGHGGSLNSFLSYMALMPELGVGVFISQNSEDAYAPVGGVTTLIADRELMRERGAPLFPRIVSKGQAEAAGAAPAEDADVSGVEAGGATVSGAANQAAVDNASEVAGRYLTNRRQFTGVEKFFSIPSVQKVIADGDVIYTEGASNTPFRRLAPDVYENRRGDRIVFVRDDKGRVVRFAGSSGTNTLERVSGLADPKWAMYAFGATLALSLTTWLGLWRRVGRGDEVTGAGRALSVFALAATVPAVAVAGLVFQMVSAIDGMSYAEIFADYPPGHVGLLIVASSVAAVTGVLMGASLLPVWTGSGWSIWRKGHHTLFALAYLAAAAMLWKWGLAFSSHIAA
ncbi:MAG: serine hydrolase domain-containing protein [Pseudomonadota bacterium]